MREKSALIVRCLILLFAVLTCRAGSLQDLNSTDETALRQLIERYFASHTNASLDDYAGLWSESSPDLLSRRQALERILATTTLRYSTPRVARLKLAGERATIWVTTRRTAIRSREGAIATTTPVALSLEFVCEPSGWKLWREASAVAELAAELVASRDDREREQLLSLDPDLSSRDLLILLWGQADRDYASGNYPRALILQRLMLRIAVSIGSKLDQASAWRNIGSTLYVIKNYAEAITAYQASIALVTEDDRKFELASLWNGLALSYAAEGNRDLALDAYNKSLAFSRDIGDGTAVANTLDSVAGLHREDGEYAQASGNYREALAIREALKDRAAVASTIINLAELEYEQGENDRALVLYEKALGVLQAIGRPPSLVNVLHNIASLYYLQGNYDLALTHYQREREAADLIASLPGAAAALSGIGLVQTLYGDYPASLEAYRLCLAIWRQLKDDSESATALQKIGRVHLAQMDYGRAAEQFRAAIDLRKKIGDERETAWALLDLGSALASLREFAEALEVDQLSLSIFEKLQDQSGTGAALIHLAGIHFVQEDYTGTIDLAVRAAGIAREANDSEIFWQARHRQGRAHYRLKQSAPARRAFLDAIATLEAPKSGSAENRPQRVLDDRLAPYLAMVDVTIHGNSSVEAFSYAERAKTRSLKGLLAGNTLRITNGMTSSEQVTEQQLQTRRAVLFSQIARERERESPTRLTELTAKLRVLEKESRAFEQSLYRLHPALKALRGEATPVQAKRVGSLLTSPSDSILEFVETDEEVYLLVFGARRAGAPRLDAYALGVSRPELAERVIFFQDLIARRQPGWERLARELYDLLLKPAEGQLKDARNLIVVPDGWLWNLPFGALQPVEDTFVIDRYSISLVSSVSALRLMREQRNRPRVGGTLLALGAPSLNQAATERMRIARRAESFTGSPESAREVGRLRELYGTVASHILIGSEASIDRLNAELKRATRLHLAVPVVLSEASPLYSQMAVAPPAAASSESGLIQLRDFLAWRSRADIAVLSSSELVPLGQSAGRGLTALSWSVLVAGTPAVLCSQWRTEGATTGDLAVSFHRELRTSRGRALAWQKAIRSVSRTPELRHPFNWAGFVIIGDGH